MIERLVTGLMRFNRVSLLRFHWKIRMHKFHIHVRYIKQNSSYINVNLIHNLFIVNNKFDAFIIISTCMEDAEVDGVVGKQLEEGRCITSNVGSCSGCLGWGRDILVPKHIPGNQCTGQWCNVILPVAYQRLHRLSVPPSCSYDHHSIHVSPGRRALFLPRLLSRTKTLAIHAFIFF